MRFSNQWKQDSLVSIIRHIDSDGELEEIESEEVEIAQVVPASDAVANKFRKAKKNGLVVAVVVPPPSPILLLLFHYYY